MTVAPTVSEVVDDRGAERSSFERIGTRAELIEEDEGRGTRRPIVMFAMPAICAENVESPAPRD